MSFQPSERIKQVMIQADCDYGQALRLIDLYDLIVWIKSSGDEPSLNRLARNRCTTYPLVRRSVTLMAKLGWLSFITIDGEGTSWSITGAAPLDATIRHVPNAMTVVPPPQPADAALALRTNAALAQTTNAAMAQDGLLNGPNNPLNHQKEEPTNLEKETIQLWNDLKPGKWKKISSISPSRARTIKALGGYRKFIDQLPAFFDGVATEKFWREGEWAFEAVMGYGVVPKAHFTKLVEAGLDSNSNTAPDNLKHPDFFPPTDPWSELRPKHHDFIDDDDRDRREVEARKFYAAQEASK